MEKVSFQETWNLSDYRRVLKNFVEAVGTKPPARGNPLVALMIAGEDGPLGTLEPPQQRGFLEMLYKEQRKAFLATTEIGLPVQGAFAGKVKDQRFFNFLVCGTLVAAEGKQPLIEKISPVLVAEPADRELVAFQLRTLRQTLAEDQAPWVRDCVDAYGAEALQSYVEQGEAQLKTLWAEAAGKEQASLGQGAVFAPVPSGLAQEQQPSQEEPRKPQDDQGGESYPEQAAPNVVANHYDNITPDDVETLLGDLIGQQAIKQEIRALRTSFLYDLVRGQTTGIGGQLGYRNIVLTGSLGSGRATMADLLAQMLSAYDAVGDKRAIEISAPRLIGGALGQTEQLVRQMVEEGRGGIIIVKGLDQLLGGDDVNSYQSGAIAMLASLMEEDQREEFGTVYILTGSKDGMQALFASNPTFAAACPQRLELAPFTEVELGTMLRLKAAARGYEMLPETAERAQQVLGRARRVMGPLFPQGHAVVQMLDLMARAKGLALGDSYLQDVHEDRVSTDDFFDRDDELTPDLVPQFSSKLGGFVTATPRSLMDGPEEPAPRGKIVPFRKRQPGEEAAP